MADSRFKQLGVSESDDAAKARSFFLETPIEIALRMTPVTKREHRLWEQFRRARVKINQEWRMIYV
jgi:hypothetical protein